MDIVTLAKLTELNDRLTVLVKVSEKLLQDVKDAIADAAQRQQ